MKESSKKAERIAIVWHPNLPEAKAEGMKIYREIRKNFSDVATAQAWSLYDEKFRQSLVETPFDLVITLGGDGTMLRTSKLCAPLKVPVCGINMGSFGFMMEVQQNQWKQRLPDLIEGNWKIEKRMMLHVELIRKQGATLEWDVLNDAVIGRGNEIRPIQVSVKVSGFDLTDYISDGLIVATATGSTAYAMAAGGPILEPELRNIMVLPICPHISLDRAIILSEQDVVEISVSSRHEAVFSPDGSQGLILSNSDRILISASRDSARYVRLEGDGFFYRNFIQYMQRNPAVMRKRK